MTHLPQGTMAWVDVSGCDHPYLRQRSELAAVLQEGCMQAGATILDISTFSAPEPGGITAVAVLLESHAVIHTYPEHGVYLVDAFTCGRVDPSFIIGAITRRLGGSSSPIEITFRKRGFAKARSTLIGSTEAG